MFKVHRSFELSTGVKNNSIAVINSENITKVIYHKTVVFERDALSKRITLRNGGWDTVSTRLVINRALQLSGEPWFLDRVRGTTMLKSTTGFSIPFTGCEVLQ